MTTAHGWRLDGKPVMYQRPGAKQDGKSVRLGDDSDVSEIRRFFNPK